MRLQKTQFSPAGLRGFTLLELVMAMAIFVVVAMAMMICFTRAATSDTVSSENVRARAAAALMMDEIRDYALQSFDTTYACYNGNPSDDPEGCGTAPGNVRNVLELDSPNGAATLRVEFPEQDDHLREDVIDADWAMPRDLDGDGAVGQSWMDTRYRLLPVRVVVAWQGAGGPRTYSLVTVITGKVRQ